ncbi:MAG TPA: hypothetical protein VEU62_10225 [Bryobacterales bacterium]|nr:hypothetical protein [Bryobacterales bacterium]
MKRLAFGLSVLAALCSSGPDRSAEDAWQERIAQQKFGLGIVELSARPS